MYISFCLGILKFSNVTNDCNHEKIYEGSMMMSYPPKRNWICKKCEAKGITVIGIPNRNKETFGKIKKMFEL
ncbi:hypothetical protein [Bacillus wiedmannii]|uniref:hypothetical protein n=1 Tax=Bacillus wiedmannii TaxID=1890302 RepID=UPI00065B4DB5|nr:hypothetical protein [Bacillus wiedmannii]KMP28797.1 hypothetical protein TU50_06165 [Bacillus wiedmannii]